MEEWRLRSAFIVSGMRTRRRVFIEVSWCLEDLIDVVLYEKIGKVMPASERWSIAEKITSIIC